MNNIKKRLTAKILQNVLKPLLVEGGNINFSYDRESFENVESDLQKAKEDDIVFYKICRDEESESTFAERLKDSSYGILIVNRFPSFLRQRPWRQRYKNIFVVDETHFLPIQSQLLDNIYPNEQKITLVGVTGTNGKTTVVGLACQIAQSLGVASLSVGTMGVRDGEGRLLHNFGMTTPPYIELRKIMAHYGDSHPLFFLEVSAHGLDQQRLFDRKLSIAAWTSFSQDHLDYYCDMESYFLSKIKIKDYLEKGGKLIVPDRERDLFDDIQRHFRNVKKTRPLSEYPVKNIPFPLENSFHRNNLELALALNEELWGELPEIDMSLFSSSPLPLGRFSMAQMSKGVVIIDYAHTPMALEKVAQMVKAHLPHTRFSIVFGCGGDRDKLKRPLMGKIANQYGDRIYITSDNPRSERCEKIMEEIIDGIEDRDTDREEKKISCEVDRKKAIEKALSGMIPGEVLLIAGKGHEDYQEFKEEKVFFSDFKVVEKFKEKEKKVKR